MGKTVPVLDARGNVLGRVSQSATSIGASKVAGFDVEFSCKDGRPAWVPSTKQVVKFK
jgi:hypothetical protein